MKILFLNKGFLIIFVIVVVIIFVNYKYEFMKIF